MGQVSANPWLLDGVLLSLYTLQEKKTVVVRTEITVNEHDKIREPWYSFVPFHSTHRAYKTNMFEMFEGNGMELWNVVDVAHHWIHQLEVLFNCHYKPGTFICIYKVTWLNLQKSTHLDIIDILRNSKLSRMSPVCAWDQASLLCIGKILIQVPVDTAPGTFFSRSIPWGFHSFHLSHLLTMFFEDSIGAVFWTETCPNPKSVCSYGRIWQGYLHLKTSWRRSCTSKRSSANFAMVRQPQQKVIEKIWKNDCWLVWQWKNMGNHPWIGTGVTPTSPGLRSFFGHQFKEMLWPVLWATCTARPGGLTLSILWGSPPWLWTLWEKMKKRRLWKE